MHIKFFISILFEEKRKKYVGGFKDVIQAKSCCHDSKVLDI